jgi:hypothetical protein
MPTHPSNQVAFFLYQEDSSCVGFQDFLVLRNKLNIGSMHRLGEP